ncbi:hypothetical protein E4U21_007379 [Claviceps maximensis]|nr:hypothetical protein E4U21_007379 [Claviceps maximensis]
MEKLRRNPKRKVSEVARDDPDNEADDLLWKACSSLTVQDIEDWQGWVELESEPTTNNACATVALLNIIMNAPDIELGQQLADFKEATKDLDTFLRGHSISCNSFIRSIHNSFTRRMDHLNADLCLENDYTDASSRVTKKKPAAGKVRQRGAKRKRASLEYGYHFIAYVPCEGLVWELDGLRSNPHEIGPINGNDWTTIAKPQIEARMLQYEGSQLSFNLLAVCRNSSSHLSKVIATMVAALHAIDSRMKDNAVFVNMTSADEPLLSMDNEAQLAEFNICKEDIDNAKLPTRIETALFSSEWQADEVYDIYQSLRVQLKSAMNESRAELCSADEENRRVKNRKRDYSGALHCWAKKLAEKGVLQDIIDMSS